MTMNRNYKDKELIKKLYPFIKPYLKVFIISLLLTLVLVLLDLLGPFLQGRVIEYLSYSEKDFILKFGSLNTSLASAKFRVCLIIASIYLGAVILSATLNYISTMMLQKSGQNMIYDLRMKVFVHIEELSIGQINKEPVGRLVTRVTNDTNALSDLCTNVLVNLFRYIFTIIGVLVMMLILSWKLTLFMLIIGPLLFLATFFFRKYSRRVYRDVRTNITNVNSFLSENISGMKITQIFNQEKKKLAEFRERNNKLRKSNIKEIFVFSIFQPAIYVLYVLSQILVLSFGVMEFSAGRLLIGDLSSYYSYIGSFFTPIQNLADQFNKLQQALASCEKIFDILDREREILDSKNAVEIDHFKGDIEFKNVWFAYNDENWILRDVSFKVNAGQTVAFVGATGAGKTTILGLIVRNYEIQRGEILIDGINIKKIKIESLRKAIGQMLQDVFLFSGTIRDNIRLRDEAIDDNTINEACHLVNADTFINKLNDRLDYRVEERGANFSQGERQLLSFARTIAHKPSVLILDEATANIDTETEKIIQDSLEKMMDIGTMLIVAHRLSTVQHADKIIVLHKGEIKEMGNHRELLSKKGLYYSLYELQYKHLEKNL